MRFSKRQMSRDGLRQTPTEHDARQELQFVRSGSFLPTSQDGYCFCSVTGKTPRLNSPPPLDVNVRVPVPTSPLSEPAKS